MRKGPKSKKTRNPFMQSVDLVFIPPDAVGGAAGAPADLKTPSSPANKPARQLQHHNEHT